MATMRWQKVSVPISQGVDTKTDSKALQPGKLANLENGVFTKGGSIVKRNGYTKVSKDVISSGADIAGVKGMYRKDSELLLADGERLLSYMPNTDQWVTRGRFKAPAISTETVVDTDDKQLYPDCATAENVTVYAWEHNGAEGVNISIVNETTGAIYLGPTLVKATSYRPRVIAVGGTIHVYFYAGGTLYRLIVHPANIDGLLTTGVGNSYSSVVTDLHGSICVYDVIAGGDDVYIAYRTSHGSNKLKVLHETSAGVNVRTLDYNEPVDIACIAIAREPNTGKLCVAWQNATNGVRAAILSDLLQVLYVNVVDSGIVGATVCPHVACAFKRDAATRDMLYSLDLELSSSQFAQYKEDDRFSVLNVREDFTIELWFKPESIPGSGYIEFISRHEGTSGNIGYAFRWNQSTTKPELLIHDASGSAVTVTSTATWTPSAGTWYHLAVVRDKSAGEVDFYVNGSALGSTVGSVTTDTLLDSGARFRVGMMSAGGTTIYTDGMFSDVRVWDSERSSSDISNNYQAELSPTFSANLKAYWKFNNSYTDEVGSISLTPSSSPGFVHKGVAAGPAVTATDTETLSDNYPCVIFAEVQDASYTYDNRIRKSSIAINGDVVAGAEWKRHAALASGAWAHRNDVHVNVVFESTLQSTYFTYMDDGTMVAKMTPGVSGGVNAASFILPGVQDLGNEVFQWAGGYKKRLDTTASDPGAATTTVNAIYSAKGIKRHRMDYGGTPAMVQSGNTGYFAGGQVWQYDGVAVTEAGFSLFPENHTGIKTGSGSDNLEVGDYYYKVYFAWTNANGERERSTTAAPIKVTTDSSNKKVALTLRTFSHTIKLADNSLAPVQFEIYRTQVGPSLVSPYYKVSSDDPTDGVSGTDPNKYIENIQSANTITFYDNISDTDLLSKEVDYQNSGELQNVSPPSASVIAEGKERIWLAGVEDTSEIFYSKVRFPDEPVNFNTALRMTVPEDGGAITALRILNNNLIVFKERAIYILPGEGPNNLGFGDFGAPQLISSDVGCKDQRGIAEVPDGLMFQSSKGVYTLTKQYQTVYSGALVEAYNDQDITSTIVPDTKNYVLFIASSGKTLLFDFLFKQWSTFTNHTGSGGVYWNGSICYGQDDGTIYRESSTLFTDAGAPVKLKLETAWIKLDTLQGFQRVRRAMVLGEFRSTHRLAMDVAYNYDDLKRRLMFDAGENVDKYVFGTDESDEDNSAAEFGDATPFGSGTQSAEMESSVYQFRAHLPVQKCQAVKFYFEDLASVGSSLAEGYEITELMLEVGVKRTGFKTADTRSI